MAMAEMEDIKANIQSHFKSNIPLAKARHTLSSESKDMELHPAHHESRACHMPSPVHKYFE